MVISKTIAITSLIDVAIKTPTNFFINRDFLVK